MYSTCWLDGYNLKAEQVRDRRLFATQQRNIEDPSHFRWNISFPCEFRRFVQDLWPRKRSINQDDQDGPAWNLSFLGGSPLFGWKQGIPWWWFIDALMFLIFFSPLKVQVLQVPHIFAQIQIPHVVVHIPVYPNYVLSKSQSLVDFLPPFCH